MRVRVKICGLRTPETVEAAVAAGADAIGFVFADSPRRIEPREACALSRLVPPFVARVAVFHRPDPDEAMRVIDAVVPSAVQTEPDPALVDRLGEAVPWLPVLHDDGVTPLDVPAGVSSVILEAAGRGGSGVRPDWDRAAALARRVRLVLAGGLDASNVADAIRHVRPFGVDVSSGVERSRGEKDPAAIAAFVAAVREVAA